jgi:hypothetical protein
MAAGEFLLSIIELAHMFYFRKGRGFRRPLTTTQLSLESGDRVYASYQPVRRQFGERVGVGVPVAC